MVTLKVQSLSDIVEAYFKTLGFSGRNLKIAVKVMNDKYSSQLNPNDVIGSMDELLLANIKKNFSDNKLNNMQKVAMFKAEFLRADGAKKGGVDAFTGEKISPELIIHMEQSALVIVPDYKISKMEPQKIETARSMHFLGRLFNIFHKG